MRQILLGILFTLSISPAYSQKIQKAKPDPYAETDKKALQLPQALTGNTSDIASYINSTFQSDDEKVRGIFIWLASNIEYDIANMFAINFYEKKEDRIAKVLSTKRGICIDYADLFQDICTRSGITSYVVEGYTKQNGFADYIPHAWCAAKIDTGWFMFDPTWGSGYISNGRFVRKVDNKYYKAAPMALIHSHMPFDYLWQFLYYPVSNQEFYEEKIQPNDTKQFFSYKDSIDAYNKMSRSDQLTAAAARIEKNGTRNGMIFDRLHHIKLEIEQTRQQTAIDLYNGAVNDYNNAVGGFNAFIDYRNKQFTPLMPDVQIQNMMDTTFVHIRLAKAKLHEIRQPDASLANTGIQLTNTILELEGKVKEQQDWLNTYFKKNKVARRSMFYQKVSLFGIPVK